MTCGVPGDGVLGRDEKIAREAELRDAPDANRHQLGAEGRAAQLVEQHLVHLEREGIAIDEDLEAPCWRTYETEKPSECEWSE